MEAALNSIWVLVCACLVFLMHAGFALVESGFCRRKNAVMVLLKNYSVLTLSSIAFYLCGFAFMFGENAIIPEILGISGFAPRAGEVFSSVPENMPLFVFLFFQLVFAATAATIVSGAVAERSRLGTFLLFTLLATGVGYPVLGHWVWGGGWLADAGFHDFAGSTVVHAVGGAMALVGAACVGPRHGKYMDKGVRPMPAHNFPLAALGVFILWFGWFGFNGGSTLAADPNSIAAIILVTNLSGSAGFLASLLHVRLRTGYMDLSMGLNGGLAGLVAITAGADVIGPLESILVGAVGGVLVVEGVLLLDRLRIDDPVGAVPVHLFGGLFGTVAVGLFAGGDAPGLFHGGGWSLLGVQILGAATVSGAAAAFSALVWLSMKYLVPGGIRVSQSHEREGLDLAECGVEAYGDEIRAFGPSEEAQQQSLVGSEALLTPASD